MRASAGEVRAQAAGNGLDVARVGFALVGMRSAVRRNRLRRQLREAVRPLLAQLAGHDVVLVAGAPAEHLSATALRAAVATCTGRALERAHSASAAVSTDNEPMTAPGAETR